MDNIKKNIKQYSLLVLSNFGVLLIAFLTNIFMTKILSENDYGIYRYVLNIITMIVSLTNFGLYYSTARLLATADKSRCPDLYGATISMMLIISIFVGTIIGIGYKLFMILTNTHETSVFLALPLIFTIMLQRTFTYMLKGSNRITDISIQTAMPQIIIFCVYSIVFLTNAKINYVNALTIYGISFLAVHLITIIRLKAKMINGLKKENKNILTEHKANGFQIYTGSLFSVFTADVLNVLIGTISTKADYAAFTLGISLSAPIIQIPSMMGVVFFKKNANMQKLSKKSILVTFVISFIALIGLNIAIALLFPFIYGDSYNNTMKYVVFLSVGYMFHGIGDYFNNFLNAHGQGKAIKQGAFFCGITQLLLAAALIPFIDIWGVVFARIISSFVYFINMIFAYIKYTRLEKNNRIKGE